MYAHLYVPSLDMDLGFNWDLRILDSGDTPGNYSRVPELFERHITHVVYEVYALYPWVDQSFSTVPTLRMVGALEYLCWQKGLPAHNQTASSIKQSKIFDNAHLRDYGLYRKKQHHANDAMRHLLRHLMSGKKAKFEVPNVLKGT